jgi:hypothetical protein
MKFLASGFVLCQHVAVPNDAPEQDQERRRALLIGCLGMPLLAFILDCEILEVESVLAQPGNDKQAHALEQILSFLSDAGIDQVYDAPPEQPIEWLMEVGDQGQTRASMLRGNSPLDIAAIAPNADNLSQSLAALALGAYPALLLPSTLPVWFTTADVRFLAEQSDRRLDRVLRDLPDWRSFVGLIETDKAITKAFAHETPNRGRFAAAYFNTGHGGPIFREDVPSLIIRAAWRRVQATGATTEARLIENVLQQLAAARRLLVGRTAVVTARTAFTGVVLPAGLSVDLGHDGIVRPASEDDRRHAPASLQQQLQGAADNTGNRVTINYDGDIVLEYPYPCKAWIAKPGDDSSSWQQRVPPATDLERVLLRLRVSLLFAAQQRPRPHIVPTWQYIDEPFNNNAGASSWDPRLGTGLIPTQLTSEDVRTWKEWYRLLSLNNVGRIDLALTRVLKATAERREPADVLVDSVIAWEKMFGTKEGEPTFRVTTCLAKLLKETLAERRALRSQLTKVYQLRSDVVHGNRTLSETDHPLCYVALDIAIDAIKTLVDKRPDLLAEGDGAGRSAALLLGD